MQKICDVYGFDEDKKPQNTIALACADRSCRTPKPGAAYENQPDGAAGGPPGGRRGPAGPRRARGDAVACPGGPNINRAPIRDSRATRRMTTNPELRWKAHIFFSVKIDIPRKLTYFLVLLQLAKRLCPFKLYRNSVQGDVVNSKSYCTNAKTHRDQASWVTDLSHDLTKCDTETWSLTTAPLARAPRDEITACDQVPHSDVTNFLKKVDMAQDSQEHDR